MSAYRKFVDTLQSEPRIPAPPKPPNAPKANPSEPVSLPVLGGLGTLGAPPIRNVISRHAATPPPLSFSARAIWDDFKDENAANGEHGSDLPLAGTAITTPGKWVERRLRRQFAWRENGAVEYLHLAVDDHSRRAYSEILAGCNTPLLPEFSLSRHDS